MIANITNGYDTASLRVPFSSFELAGILAYLGEDHLGEYELSCSGEKKYEISVSLEPTGIAERNIAEIARGQGVSLARLNGEMSALEAIPYGQRLGVLDRIASERPQTMDDVRGIIHEASVPSVTTHFYCPLTVMVYTRNRWGDLDSEGYEEDGSFAARYVDKIRQKLREYNADDEHNMAEYFSGNNSLRMKLRSAEWDFCKRNNELFGRITVETAGPMTADQEQDLKEWIRGQNSDGLGEGFEQQEISMDDGYRASGEFYVSLWHSGDDYYIDNEDEFEDRLASQAMTMGGI